jgi:lipopolysaccharide/colanic/teichoic acid biosynthesis glycosyltransferase
VRHQAWGPWMKLDTRRLVDILVAAIGLAVLALPLGIVGIAVRVSSPGPVIFCQRRIGRGGRPFRLYKFRTMYHKKPGAQVTVDADSRVTPIGRKLRRWKIDELPQLWNVLRGDMRIIGPRPEVEQFVRYYSPEQRQLLEQTPGLAGMSQLVYRNEGHWLKDSVDPEESYIKLIMPRKLAIDLQYESTRTWWSDVRLIGDIVMLILGKSSRAEQSGSPIASQVEGNQEKDRAAYPKRGDYN